MTAKDEALSLAYHIQTAGRSPDKTNIVPLRNEYADHEEHDD
jgi:hypothetical protein